MDKTQIFKTKLIDSWGRPIYKTHDGKILKDTNCGNGEPDLHFAYDIEGEPEYRVKFTGDK